MKILVADDDARVLDVVTRILSAAGHQVLTAVDGDEAIRRIHESHPDLVLMDIRMPRKDGASAAQELRDDPGTREIPVVFLTGLIRASEAQHRRGLSGSNLFLAKPFDANDLLRMIDLATHQEPPPGED